ncbi:MAG: hypothetical protein ACRDF4_11695 [Rhabdochlamydiaceae bacterium]
MNNLVGESCESESIEIKLILKPELLRLRNQLTAIVVPFFEKRSSGRRKEPVRKIRGNFLTESVASLYLPTGERKNTFVGPATGVLAIGNNT